MIIDGKQIAADIQAELLVRGAGGVSLHIIIVGENPVIESFVRKKREFAQVLGIEFLEYRFNESVTTDELQRVISDINDGGIVVQLPLPQHIDVAAVLAAVPPEQDVDGLAPRSRYVAPVAGAVHEVLARTGVDVKDKQVLVIGKGRLVGEPTTKLLTALGAEVTVVDKETSQDALAALARKSYIIVSGAGVPELITPDMLTDGVVLIDAGTSTQAGVLKGDIAHECDSRASVFARTPGGVGPITVAVLFKNLIRGTIGATLG